jgi:tetratricopeptide (TPR) repeat protein
VLDGIPPGSDSAEDPTDFTRVGLYVRAATYFASVRWKEPEHVGQLYPEFSEIDLRLRAAEYQPWQYRVAFYLMNRLDREHLTDWGYSDALASWRDGLKGKLVYKRDEAVNLSYLVAAHEQQENYGSVLDDLAAARRHARGRGRTALVDSVDLTSQVAGAYFDADRLGRARHAYRRVIRLCRWIRVYRRLGLLESVPVDAAEAEARASLAVCLARTGDFDGARREHRNAGLLVGRLTGDERAETEALHLLNYGWTLGQFGDVEAALGKVQRATQLARDGGRVLFEGLCLDSEASLLIDWRAADAALEPAKRAAEIGIGAHNARLCREANVTLALVHLRLGNLEDAWDAARAAARHRHSDHALGAFGMLGIAAFRLGRETEARAAFRDACTRARHRLEREPRAYHVLDCYGLALCGLALLGNPASMGDAITIYQDARKVTRAEGAVRRSDLLLELLGADSDPDLLEPARAAARGTG